jgi:PAS domain S-box-containing protein
MARRGLRLELRAALREAVETRATILREHIEVELDDRKQFINLAIEPFGSPDEPLFLVLFTDVGPPFAASSAEQALASPPGGEYFERVEQDLRDTRERLQSTIEEYETAVEELKSSNEELQSINEELQSTNEELETMNEELQSTNDELHTINDELRTRSLELDEARTFGASLIDSIRMGLVVVDRDMRVVAWNRSCEELWGLRAEETTGSVLFSLDFGLPMDGLKPLIGKALVDVDSLGEATVDAVNRRGRSARVRVTCTPFRAPNDAVNGALLLMEPQP